MIWVGMGGHETSLKNNLRNKTEQLEFRRSWSPEYLYPRQEEEPKNGKICKKLQTLQNNCKNCKNVYICTDLQNFEKILQTNTKYWKKIAEPRNYGHNRPIDIKNI